MTVLPVLQEPRPHSRPWRFESTRPGFLRLANRIAGNRRKLPFPWNGQAAELSFSALPPHSSGLWTFTIDLAGRVMQLNLHRLPDVAWISPSLAGIELSTLPKELACGVLEACFAEALAQLTKVGLQVTILDIAPFSHANASTEFLHWNINRGSESSWMHGTLSGDDTALTYLGNLLSKIPTTAAPLDEDITVPIALSAGTMRCPITLLKELVPHDVLLAEVQDYMNLSTCEIRIANSAAGTATVRQKTVTLQQLNIERSRSMEEPTHPTLPVDELEIELNFLVGQTTLTLRELRSLAPGAVFELPTSVSQAVTICANGRAIGHGELLEVGDRVGIRIIDFNHP